VVAAGRQNVQEVAEPAGGMVYGRHVSGCSTWQAGRQAGIASHAGRTQAVAGENGTARGQWKAAGVAGGRQQPMQEAGRWQVQEEV